MVRPRRVGVLSGGSGSSKFVSAFANFFEEHNQEDISVVPNVGDNFWRNGLLVCPDLDITMYALSGKLDRSKHWGIRSDTFHELSEFESLTGSNEWFMLGDRDQALSCLRTDLIKHGWSLSAITETVRNALGIRVKVVPPTDDKLITYLATPIGLLHLQEFWVKNKGQIPVYRVSYVGQETARPTDEALEACSSTMIVCPANPITSIMPTLALKPVRRALRKARPVVISPFVGRKIISGPAASLMRGLGHRPDLIGVASLYSDFVRLMVVDNQEPRETVSELRARGIECVKTDIVLRNRNDQRRFARYLEVLL